MSNNLEQLMALGAQCVGGSIIWKHKLLGVLRDGDFHINDEGRKALEIVDVEVKEVKQVEEEPVRRRRAAVRHEPPAATDDGLVIDVDA